MMAAPKPFVDSGDYIGFWKIALYYGDPLAQLALDFHATLFGKTFGNRVAISKLELAYNHGKRMSYDDLAKLKAEVGRGVMEYHYSALEDDIANNWGTPGVLSVEQIDDYHYAYFNTMGLPDSTYGGSLFAVFPASVRQFMYCSGCDPIAPP